jgi:hypothetical protein
MVQGTQVSEISELCPICCMLGTYLNLDMHYSSACFTSPLALILLVGLCTIVRGDNNNEVLLVSWYWYDSL